MEGWGEILVGGGVGAGRGGCFFFGGREKGGGECVWVEEVWEAVTLLVSSLLDLQRDLDPISRPPTWE